MNKRVIKVMIALTIVFLLAQYILKIFFPAEFVMSINETNLVSMGEYIDTHLWATLLMGIILGFTTDYLYFGAVCGKFKLSKWLLLTMLIYNIAFTLCYNLLPQQLIINHTNLITAISIAYMLITPLFFTNSIYGLAITYSVNCVAQNISLAIRNFTVLLTNVNSLTMLVFSMESYLWLLLLFWLFNYKKEVKVDGVC